MKGTSLAKFLAVTFVIAILSYLAYYGYSTKAFSLGAKYIRQGMDIKGGVYIVYQPETDKEITGEQLDSAREVIRKRLDNRGLYDASVTIDNANKRIVVEVPGEKDIQKAANEIGKTAKLQFKDINGKVIVEGADIVNAKAEQIRKTTTSGMQWVVQLTFSQSGLTKFADGTDWISKQPSPNNIVGIYLDDAPISLPAVHERIDQNPYIEGNFNAQSAKELADTIRSGALPFSLKIVQQEGIGPVLGQQALNVSITSGIISFILIAVFMIVMYRLPGIAADLALIAYTAITLLILSLFKITLTLPGIAGIILSIAMSLDANVVIFERVKEELKAGKTLRGSVETGFRRAMAPIIDSNITTLAVSVILFMLGTGPVKGFGATLFIGVLLSLFSAVTLTRYLLIQIMGLGLRQTWLYGYKGGSANV